MINNWKFKVLYLLIFPFCVSVFSTTINYICYEVNKCK